MAVARPKPAAGQVKKKKSGIKTLKQGEILFKENDPASSLYIIQKGQLRLFRPKGKGFVDLAILRAGEVIGEMAYFDIDSRRRSCSASAIVETEIIEVSFPAFEKTMAGLNPWFKTIINTLADRLRKTNEKVRDLESNSVGYGKGGVQADYKFFQMSDILKMLSTLYLTLKSHGEVIEGGVQIHANQLKFYLFEVFVVSEIRFEEFFELLKDEKIVALSNDDEGMPRIYRVENVESLKSIVTFLNSQRRLEDSKKINISPKCEILLKRMIDQANANGATGASVPIDMSTILDALKLSDIPVTDEDIKDAVAHNLSDDIIVGENNKLTANLNYNLAVKVYPSIKIVNAINKVNATKSGVKKY